MEEVFAEQGLLAKALAGYAFRPQQLKMAEVVAESFERGGVALVEAGTGTGKSLAYLVPALLSGRRTVISTHTINLQEQLVAKDIPVLLKALAPDARAVLVKGMGNYLCLRRLADAPDEEGIEEIRDWAQETEEGSRADLPSAPRREVWDKVAAEGESCTHARCPYYKECHFFRARKVAEKADLLVVNHHLLMADLRARAEEGQLLPDYDQLIIDEAHHLEDVATEALAWRLSRRQLIRWLDQLVNTEGGKLAQLRERIGECDNQRLSLALETDLPMEKHRLVVLVNEAFGQMGQLVQGEELRLRVTEGVRPQLGKDVDSLIEELKRFAAAVLRVVEGLEEALKGASKQKSEGVRQEVSALAKRVERAAEGLVHFVREELGNEEVRWIELNRRGTNVTLVGARLDVSQLLQEQLFEAVPATVLTSATLTSRNSFGFYRKRLGLASLEVTEVAVPSPFAYKQQTQLLIATDLPSPSHPHFVERASEAIQQVIRSSRGNAFVLFTSYSMLRQCAARCGTSFPLFVQGEQNRAQLLAQFRKTEGAVLFGTDSFWEGVDVVGDALRCVVITKLPFKVPTEPLVQARLQAIEAGGGKPFFDYSLPQAIVKFTQGFGRLIRSPHDRGSIVCLDHRLVVKGYGKMFTESLPACPIVTGPLTSLISQLAAFAKSR